MLNIIIGVVAILLGLRAIVKNWYMFIDLLGVIIPLALLSFGIIALLAGVRALKKNKEKKAEG